MVVVIVVDWQEVSMDISVAHQQVHVGDSVNMLQQTIELLKAAWLGAVQGEAPEFCSKLNNMEQMKPSEYM